ncbi:hypothetical protein [Hydrogenophaga sp. PAMC20947]|uniref:hypothetical protein n=1 Tax=Hydrogenophaga sp. PAMC20947 TaxID=2565558 RepID=UPI00109E15F5|nr:hypothetical protein [Hydrogenophaga sp. PAMC20947]QCB46286.1 hypothetical protein E5678_09790 [Hydrogenophaga sp. PAMC20947]
MRLAPHSMLKVLVSAALLASLGAHAATTVQVTVTTPAVPEAPEAPIRQATAPKQDFATHLALADLSKQGITNPTPAEVNAAVQSIQAQRTSGMGWGEIAHSLGLKLGPVVSAANRAKRADDPKRTEVADSRKSKSTSKSDGRKGSETQSDKRGNERGNGSSNSKGNSDGGGSSGSGKGDGGGSSGNGNNGNSNGGGKGNGNGNGGGKK